MPLDIFTEVAAVVAVAAGVSAIALWLRQPIIISYILVGVLVGPAALDWVHAHDQLDLFARLGITLLLFVVGLKLELRLVRTVGAVALVAGSGQIVLTAALSYLIAIALGMKSLPAFYVAAAMAFSSTIIIVKLLSDKRAIDALHGRIALGILIVQDVVVVMLMLGLGASGGEIEDGRLGWRISGVVAKGVVFLVLVALVTRYVLPKAMRGLARSPELLVLFGMAWAVGLAALGVKIGFTKEVGAFVAGVSLATTPYRIALAARLVGVRDFVLLFFFIDLGVHIDVSSLGAAIGPALALSLFVLLGKPMMVAAFIGAMGYRKHTSAMTGLQLGQISEFSLILVTLGFGLGHVDQQTIGLVTLVGLITIGVSSYVILYAEPAYERLSPWLGVFERHTHHPERDFGDGGDAQALRVDTIVFGLGRYGGSIVRELRERDVEILGVDFDPEAVGHWHREGLRTLYGDMEDPELFHMLPLNRARWVLSTVHDQGKNLALLHALKHEGYQGRVALTAHSARTRDALDEAGAHVVLLPFLDAAKEAADLLTESDSSRKAAPARSE